ncbi:MAG: phosphoribosylamine--glycine ligase [Myxococcota bacterium]
MRVLLVGHGGRENALAWRLARSERVTSLVVCGDNPGWPRAATRREGTLLALLDEMPGEPEGLALVVVGPEAPLAEGLADAAAARDVPCFGPTAAAARLETSKAFAKEVMVAAGVPTAGALVVDPRDPDDLARARARCDRGDVVVKVDGLAAGKGVVVCETPDQAHAALAQLAAFGEAAERLVLEDRLVGPEVSVFALCDGQRAVPLLSARDHKQLLDGGRGPNTGGMGAVAPSPDVDAVRAAEIVAQVHQPVVEALAARGMPFRGVLYAGLMLTADGPRVLEFNVRFGDPECQALMPLWEDDPVPWLLGAARGALPAGRPRVARGAACCVVLASRGYPASSEKGTRIPEPAPTEGVVVFHAGTRRDPDGTLRTNGGRVLGVTGVGADPASARAAAYAAVEGWRFDGAQLRTDIGA